MLEFNTFDEMVAAAEAIKAKKQQEPLWQRLDRMGVEATPEDYERFCEWLEDNGYDVDEIFDASTTAERFNELMAECFNG